MKLKNLTDLANVLRDLGKQELHGKMGFDMRFSYENRRISDHPCGSACCIGGWVQHHNPNTRSMGLAHAVQTLAPKLSYWEFERLCYPTWSSSAWDATPEQAARAVEILRDTGKCNWYKAMK